MIFFTGSEHHFPRSSPTFYNFWTTKNGELPKNQPTKPWEASRDALVDHEDGAPRPHGVAAEIQVERTPGGGEWTLNHLNHEEFGFEPRNLESKHSRMDRMGLSKIVVFPQNMM